MTKTSIEWTDHSINPIRARFWASVGHYCEKISPGCKNCYSSRFQPRFGLPEFQEQRRSDVTIPFLDGAKLKEVLRRRTPTKWFWCDMSDMFGEWVPNEWIAACFGVMAATPQHTHQVLTKRPQRMREWFRWLGHRDGFPIDFQTATCVTAAFGVPEANDFLTRGDEARDARGEPGRYDHLIDEPPDWPLPNVWLGVSVEDQRRADERIPHLLRTPAAVRFVSYEPALGPVNFCSLDAEKAGHEDAWFVNALTGEHDDMGRPCEQFQRLNWVIAGAESGPGARPMDEAWMRSIRGQCQAADVPLFYKQRLDENGRKVSLPLLDGVQHAEWPK